MARVFVSHAGPDLESAERIARWLVDDGHDVFLDRDAQRGLVLGENWQQRLHERLRGADAVVCLLTPEYAASVWCAAELAVALSRGSRVLPLRLTSGSTHPLLPDDIQYSDLSTPDAAREHLREALLRLDAAGGAGWPDDRSPYPGLRPFDAGENRVFFGRNREVAELAGLLRSPAEPDLIVVLGPSGCGKSSLVRAGLVPLIAAEPGWWTLPAVLPGADPVGALARELAGAGRQCGLEWTVSGVRERLVGDGLRAVADDLLVAAPGGWERRRLLLVLDQLEEVVTLADAPARAGLADLLSAPGPVRTVATLRPEFLDQVLAGPELSGLPMRPFPLRPLRREMLPVVVEEPARLAGLEPEPALVDRIVADAGSGDALPLLAYSLEQLSEGVGRGGRLTLQRYEEMGGVRGALAQQADAALADAASTGRHRDQVMGTLLRLVTVDEQGRPARWRVARDELSVAEQRDADAFVRRRLLITDTENGTVVVGVAHEAFLTAWPPLADAIAADTAALRARRAVEQAAARWDESARPRRLLWERNQLGSAVSDLRDRSSLSPRGAAFLRSSVRFERRRRFRATSILAGLLVLAVIGGLVAVVQRQTAQEQQRAATGRQLLAQAASLRARDPFTAIQLFTAAYRIHPSDETRSGLASAVVGNHFVARLRLDGSSIDDVAYAPDGSTMATASRGQGITLWDTRVETQPRPVSRPGGIDPLARVGSLAYTPDGRTLVAGDRYGLVGLWDVGNPRAPRLRQRLVAAVGGWISALVIDGSGQYLAVGTSRRTVVIWDIRDPDAPRALGSPLLLESRARSLALKGEQMAVGTEGGQTLVFVMDVPGSPRHVATIQGAGDGLVTAVRFTGSALVTGEESGDVAVFDLSRPAVPRRVATRRLGSAVNAVDVGDTSPFDLAIATGGRTVVVWNTLGNTLTDATDPFFGGHTDRVHAVAFRPGGDTLVSGSEDGTAIVWSLAGAGAPSAISSVEDHDGPVVDLATSDDHRLVASLGSDGTVMLWSLADARRPKRRGTPLRIGEPANTVALSPDGRRLAVGSTAGNFWLWDVTDPAMPRAVPGTTDVGQVVLDLAFSRDGRVVTVGTERGPTRWDVTDPRAVRRLEPPLGGHPAYAVAFSSRGVLAAADVTGEVRLWDPRRKVRNTTAYKLSGYSDGIRSMAFAPDGDTLATGGNDGTLMLWDVHDATAPRPLIAGVPAHAGAVRSLAFSPDGSTLASTGMDSTTSLWDLTDRSAPHRLGQQFLGGEDSVVFGPNGDILAAASADGSIELWDLAAMNRLRRDPARAACNLTGGLNREQWARFVPDLDYVDTCPR
ncbi:TIR domain-containing protein [Cryptosporangium aurantiacum]|uniref:WD-40 repeat-containing protein n=1 Tax=Cryptosporangium aurantiacum TaxID=134849 RepID=A0A1M7RJV4_9ACTN|nr:TIR domain-containing protein [Cryptosporangium aurantiacum]SHN46587.1 WD-40 repeat-containing protein [Cryptosporangium aurantiacum]